MHSSLWAHRDGGDSSAEHGQPYHSLVPGRRIWWGKVAPSHGRCISSSMLCSAHGMLCSNGKVSCSAHGDTRCLTALLVLGAARSRRAVDAALFCPPQIFPAQLCMWLRKAMGEPGPCALKPRSTSSTPAFLSISKN